MRVCSVFLKVLFLIFLFLYAGQYACAVHHASWGSQLDTNLHSLRNHFGRQMCFAPIHYENDTTMFIKFGMCFHF